MRIWPRPNGTGAPPLAGTEKPIVSLTNGENASEANRIELPSGVQPETMQASPPRNVRRVASPPSAGIT